MAKKLDLNKLRTEIDKRKEDKYGAPSNLGESVGGGMSPRDSFLNGLLTSKNTGQPTASTNLIKVVENKISEKKGETKKFTVSETAQNVNTRPAPIDMSPERDDKFYADLDRNRNKTLAESIESFQGGGNGKPMQSTVNYGGQQYLTSIPTGTGTATGTMQINEGALVESVKNVVNNYLSENLAPVFEEAIKGTIIEMYAVERIKEVLNENRDLIKSVVVDTIREIQAKNKAKAQS